MEYQEASYHSIVRMERPKTVSTTDKELLFQKGNRLAGQRVVQVADSLPLKPTAGAFRRYV